MTGNTLQTSPENTWGNTILYRLAEALGLAPEEDGVYRINPDYVLQMAEKVIREHQKVR